MKHPNKDLHRRVGVAGCKHTTRDLIEMLDRHGFLPDHCLTISPAQGEKHKVAGYFDLRPFLREKDIPFTLAHKYSLKSEEDKRRLLALDLDLMLVTGWQRLIPGWFLDSLSVGAFGMHGSSKPLPHGRGRSPMNWSLIQGKRTFFTHLFQYKPGVDDGPIVGRQAFEINDFDTAHTLHLKNLLSMSRLVVENLPALMEGTADLTPQPEEAATYYPKRTAEDGLIYWEESTWDIYSLIRAVTRPFPGAFSFLDNDPDQKILIWRAQPFDPHLTYPNAEAGEIVEVFYDGSFLVRTGDTSLLVLESEGHTFAADDVGRQFGRLDRPRKAWEDLPL